MSDQKQTLLRFASWLAPARKSSATRSNQSSDNSTPSNNLPNSTSSPTTRQARSSDKPSASNQSSTGRKPPSTNVRRTPSKPPGRGTQTSNAQPQASKAASRSSSQTPVGEEASQSSDTTQVRAKRQPSNTSPSPGTSNKSLANSQKPTTSPPNSQGASSSGSSPPKANSRSSTTSPTVDQQTTSPPDTISSQVNPQTITTSPIVGQKTPPQTIKPFQADPQPSFPSPSTAGRQSKANSHNLTTSPLIDQQTKSSADNAPSQINQQLSTSPALASQPEVTSSPQLPTNVPHHHSELQTKTELQSVIGNENEIKPSNEVVKRSSLPGKISRVLTHETSQLPSTSEEAPTPGPDKELASNSQSQSHRESNNQTDTAASQTTGISTLKGDPGTPFATQISKSNNLHLVDLKPESTKEVKEMVQDTKQKEPEKPNEEQFQGEQITTDHPEQMLMDDKQETIGIKKMVSATTPNLKQHKAANPQPRNKNVVSNSHQKQTVFKGEDTPLHKEVRDNISKFLQKRINGGAKLSTDESPVSVITLAGENRGAIMQLGSDSSSKERLLHIHRSYKLNKDDNTETAINEEKSSKETKPDNKKHNEEEDQEAKTYINSNIQSINNSIVFDGSITERNPGVHLVRTPHTLAKSFKNDEKETTETHKAEFNATTSQKLTYEPSVRRRCLRGLLLESSDSDEDSPEKPRRHGCRVACSATNQNNNVDIS